VKPYWQISSAWLIVVFASFAVGCVNTELTSEVAAVFPERATCDTEAGLLMETTVVYAAPKSGLKPVVKLEQGRFVYRCEQRGEWLGVMFPGAEEKVDCSQRRPERVCSLGWIHRDVKIRILG
jgi:hypothetical protein